MQQLPTIVRYSLLTRFQGGLLGSLIGEIIGSNSKLSDWSEIGIGATKSLVSKRILDQADWLEQIQRRRESLLDLKNTASSSEAAVATLPIALFFHESPALLEEQLLACTETWQLPNEPAEDVLAFGSAVASALTERVGASRWIAPTSTQLISQILTYLGTSPTPLKQQLEQLSDLFARQAGLEEAVTQLTRQDKGGHTPIALALYCFCYTPQDFRLCIARAAQTGYQPQVTAALAGALSGTYNSFIGIPIGWRIHRHQDPLLSEIYPLAEQLFAVWSGVYQLSNTDQVIKSAAVAPAGMIQPRSSLSIISQRTN